MVNLSSIADDAEFPEAARALALGGADVILMAFATGRMDSTGQPNVDPAMWGQGDVQRYAPAVAYCNRVFVVGTDAYKWTNRYKRS
eukprot:SAG31_NODE_2517_length_5576_cov_3.265839_3_plen_86_part_00